MQIDILPKAKLLKPIPDLEDEYVLRIDNSSLETATTCPRSAMFYKIMGRERVRSTAAQSFGTAIHLALEAHYRGNTKDVPAILEDHFFKNPCPGDDWRDLGFALDTFNAYVKWVDKNFPGGDIKIVRDPLSQPLLELPFAVEFAVYDVDTKIMVPPSLIVEGSNNHTPGLYIRKIHAEWTGRIDAVVEDAEGLLWVLDHKTSSMGGQTFFDDFVLSSQLRGYKWAAEKVYGIKVTGAMVNAIINRKPTRTGVCREFHRQRYPYSPEFIEEWRHNTAVAIGDFVASLVRSYFPAYTKWCIGKYGRCQYFDVCTLPEDSRPSMLASDFYTDVTWSPLNR